jgi:tetratricopeptide (TPR) repeat protein
VSRIRTRIFAIACRIIIAGICVFGIWCSWKLARAGYLFRLNTPESVRAAIRLEPDSWEYYMRLALIDDARAQQLLETAISLDPYNAQANIELGLRLEGAGDYRNAEKLLLDAFAIDRTYLPRWTLANFYLRRNNLPAFWAWARTAAEMPSDNMEPLFELCWRVSPEPSEIERRILNNNPDLIRQYLDFLLGKNQLPAAADVAHRLIQVGNPEKDNPQIFSVINGLIVTREGDAADSLWKLLINKHWVVADLGAPNNPNFVRDPLPVSFDWVFPSYSGLHSWPGPSGLETEFSGGQPEDCIIAEEAIFLAPGNYQLDYSYRTDGIPAKTGLRWQIIAADSETVLGQSPDLSSEDLNRAELAFSIPPEASLIYLRLQYRRPLGTPRISGTLVIPSVQIDARP